MRRFFGEIINNRAKIEGEEFLHLKTVLRLKIGDEIIVLDGSEKEYLCRIIELKKDDIVDTAMDRIKEKNILKYWRSTKITSYLLPLATTLRQRNILVEYNKLNKTRLLRFC